MPPNQPHTMKFAKTVLLVLFFPVIVASHILAAAVAACIEVAGLE